MPYVGVKPAGITSATEAEIAGNLTVDTNTLVVDATNNNVGVNTTAVAADLEVGASASKINALTVKTATGSGGVAGISFMAGQTTAGREKAAMFFKETNGGAHYTGDLVFAIATSSGSAAQVAASDEVCRITSNGLTFNGDTAAANALDDYEEGLFTPSFTSDGTNPTVSYSFQRGFYTKVGRTVFFQIQLGTTSVSVGSGSLFISGLPFTANASLQSRSGHIGLHYTWATSPVDTKWVLFANDNKLYLYPGDNVGNTMPTSYLDTGSSKNRIWIQGFYDV